jgi:hypothetical protein
LGTPLLLSGNMSGTLLSGNMSGTPLSRLSMQHDSPQPYQECLLQEVIDRFPNILPICDYYPHTAGLCSLGREIPVPVADDKEGCIDNLLVTDEGHLVIVETKLWRNPEAVRKVIAQTLQYCMAVSQLMLSDFEGCLRRGDPSGKRLGKDETVFEHVRSLAADGSLPRLNEDFEEDFGKWRRNGEILLLVVADGVHQSAERIVNWINEAVGTAPFKFGLVELCLYVLPDSRRIIVPKTLLRIREASRHVVTVNNLAGENVTITVSGSNEPPRKIPPAGIPMTEDELTKQIQANNSAELAGLAETLRSRLKSSGLATRWLPSGIQYGVDVAGDFTPLVTLTARALWFQIPMRAVRQLGDTRFVACKQKINSVGSFYRHEEVDDPTKTNALGPKYSILKGKVDSFVEAFSEIAQTVRGAVDEAS